MQRTKVKLEKIMRDNNLSVEEIAVALRLSAESIRIYARKGNMPVAHHDNLMRFLEERGEK